MKLSQEEFVLRAVEKHGNKYDYSLVEYRNHVSKILIICPTHGEFLQIANSHLSGKGCQKCGIVRRSMGRKNNIEKLVLSFRQKHGNKYDYSKMEYVKMKNRVKIMCNIHNIEFLQSPLKHLESKNGGCPKCCNNIGKGILGKEVFMEKANEIHNNKYNYDIVEYKKANKKIKIICDQHSIFEMTPNSHLMGRGCPICNRNGGILENMWLDTLNIPNKFRQYKIENLYVDGFDPINNIIYEFYGDFWHGNPSRYNSKFINKVIGSTFGDIYQKTINRECMLKNKGFSVVSIWESDFKKLQNIL